MTDPPAARAAAKAAKRNRATQRWAFVADRQGTADVAALTDAVGAKLAEAAPLAPKGAKGFPAPAPYRWVPIGPSVVRRGQGTGRPRVTGRVRALAISDDGTRAYAGSARGGVWYTGDGGLSWTPVGSWAARNVGAGGPVSAQSCGALLVSFGTTAADPDVVLVGTGELTGGSNAVLGSWGGVGVLAGTFVSPPTLDQNPWEVESGIGALQGRGIYRLERNPASQVGSTDPAHVDLVLAATNQGLVIGTRTAGPPDHYAWAQVIGLDQAALTPAEFTNAVNISVTDVVWYPSGRIVAAVDGRGLFVSDDGGGTFAALQGCNVGSGQRIAGRLTIARPFDNATHAFTNGLFVLCGVRAAHVTTGEGVPTLFAIADATIAAPVVTRPAGVPTALWPGQAWYDQALWVEQTAATPRVYLGGSFFRTAAPVTFDGGVWCFDVKPAAPPAHPTTFLAGVAGISTVADGSAVDGLIGTGVHADIHTIRLTGADAAHRHVWVGCDGGVYRSAMSGKVNTFAHRGNGLAVLEPGWCAPHPTVSQLVVAGMQDNGTQLRTGDTVWEEVFEGDGGGVVFDPVHPHRFIRQYINASWSASPADGRFCAPTSKWVNGSTNKITDLESANRSSFYSGAAATISAAGRTRLALGTNRVWLSDDLAGPAPNTWKVLPFAHPGTGRDPRPHAPITPPPWVLPSDKPSDRAFGVPTTIFQPHGHSLALGRVITLKWANATTLVVLFELGVVTWRDNAGTWSATVDVKLTQLGVGGPTFLTDIAPIPGSTDYFLTTTGQPGNAAGTINPDPTLDTCYLVTRQAANPNAVNPPRVTGLRHALDTAGPPAAVGPVDPAYAVVVDPGSPNDVYIGTVTGVWHGVRDPALPAAGPGLKFADPAMPALVNPFVNGLPQAAVQDLSIHFDQSHPTPRLLRASIQARGVWEVDLAAPDAASSTYVRVHQYDDRRRLPTPMTDPRTEFTATRMYDGDSPDIVVRPKPGRPNPPGWQGLAADQWGPGNAPAYELWTFQTAFRWLYPTVQATGEWTPEFGALVAFDRAQRAHALVPAGPILDKQLWDLVVGTRIDGHGAVSMSGADPLAVYQPPWHNPAGMSAPATEIDIVESVVPLMSVVGSWTVHAEPCAVDVLLHHRDTRPVPADQSYGVLLWRKIEILSGTEPPFDATALTTFFRACASTGLMHAPPAGWTAAGPAVGDPVTSLPVPLDARMPRALQFDVDLTDTFLASVQLLAVVWDQSGRLTIDPVLPASPTIDDYVQGWPYAAYRAVQTTTRLPFTP